MAKNTAPPVQRTARVSSMSQQTANALFCVIWTACASMTKKTMPTAPAPASRYGRPLENVQQKEKCSLPFQNTGKDGKTYSGPCEALCAGLKPGDWYEGACEEIKKTCSCSFKYPW
eukprot:1148417-Pelagomonas_calceolata.AAC.4